MSNGYEEASAQHASFALTAATQPGFAFSQWQDYQDDEDDFFDTYDSRRNERSDSRNRDLQAGGDANRQFGNKPKVFGSR